MQRKVLFIVGWALFMVTTFAPRSWAVDLSDILQGGGAFLTHLMVHETGHHVMAYMGGGQDVHLDFFKKQGGNFFVGAVSATGINQESVLPFRAAGVAASNHLFNLSLSRYRLEPTTYNTALLFFSGTDFLWYSVWSFYIKGSKDPSYDPVGISQETGLSPHAVVGMALVQTAINAYRVYSEDDTIVPYFSLDQEWAKIGVQVTF